MDHRDDVEVRQARTNEAEEIADVVSTSWAAAYEGLLPEQAVHGRSTDEDAEQIASLLAFDVPATGVLVAEAGDAIVGASLFGPRPDDPTADTRVLYMLYTLPSAWGGTAGKLLFETTRNAMESARVSTLLAEVLAENSRARSFFERQGMTAQGEDRQGWFGADVTIVRYAMDV